MGIEMTGLQSLANKFNDIATNYDKGKAKNVLLGGARIAEKKIKEKAPVGKKGYWIGGKGRSGGMGWHEPGTLKKAINSKYFRKSKAAYVAVDYSMAPYAHLPEYGARGGQMPAEPYFRPGVEESKASIGSHLAKGYKKIIDDRVRKLSKKKMGK